MISIRPVLFTLVLAFLLFDMGLSSQTEVPAGSQYKMVTSQTCEAHGCRTITSQPQCQMAMGAISAAKGDTAVKWNTVMDWGNALPRGCNTANAYWQVNSAGSSSKMCENPSSSKYGCACLCPTPTSTPTTLSPTSTPTTLAPTLTVCQTLKGEIKDKCGPESPVNKVIQKAQDAVDTSPQDPMVDLGEYKLSDLEKEQKEGTCSFAKSDPAYLATELILKINKLSTLV